MGEFKRAHQGGRQPYIASLTLMSGAANAVGCWGHICLPPLTFPGCSAKCRPCQPHYKWCSACCTARDPRCRDPPPSFPSFSTLSHYWVWRLGRAGLRCVLSCNCIWTLVMHLTGVSRGQWLAVVSLLTAQWASEVFHTAAPWQWMSAGRTLHLLTRAVYCSFRAGICLKAKLGWSIFSKLTVTLLQFFGLLSLSHLSVVNLTCRILALVSFIVLISICRACISYNFHVFVTSMKEVLGSFASQR
jgi:hypothetical protein